MKYENYENAYHATKNRRFIDMNKEVWKNTYGAVKDITKDATFDPSYESVFNVTNQAHKITKKYIDYAIAGIWGSVDDETRKKIFNATDVYTEVASWEATMQKVYVSVINAVRKI